MERWLGAAPSSATRLEPAAAAQRGRGARSKERLDEWLHGGGRIKGDPSQYPEEAAPGGTLEAAALAFFRASRILVYAECSAAPPSGAAGTPQPQGLARGRAPLLSHSSASTNLRRSSEFIHCERVS